MALDSKAMCPRLHQPHTHVPANRQRRAMLRAEHPSSDRYRFAVHRVKGRSPRSVIVVFAHMSRANTTSAAMARKHVRITTPLPRLVSSRAPRGDRFGCLQPRCAYLRLCDGCKRGPSAHPKHRERGQQTISSEEVPTSLFQPARQPAQSHQAGQEAQPHAEQARANEV